MTFPFTLVFMFLVFWRPQEWLVPTLYGWPLLDVVVYGALLSLIMEINQKQIKLPRTPMIWLSVGLWFAAILSHVAHFYFKGMLDTIPDAFKLCFFLVLLVVVVDRIERVRAVIIVMVASAVIMAIHCLMQQRLGYGFAGLPPLIRYRPLTDEWQAQSLFFGIFSDPNDAGQWLAAAIPLVFAIPRRLNPISLMMCFGVAWYLFSAMNATHSRGAQIEFSAIIATLVFLKLQTRWFPYVAIIGLGAVLVLCGLKGGGLLDASAQERVVYWGMANREFKAHPLFGLGYGMFWQVTGGHKAAHNAFVSCYTEVGIVGYWFWFSMLQLGCIGAWRTRLALGKVRNGSQAYLKRVSGLGLAAVVGFATGGYFLSRAFVFPLFFLVGLVNTMPIIAMRLLPEDYPPLIEPGKHVFGMGTLSTLFSVIYVYWTILILNKAFYG
jgi:putative inorganic carbon (hco3(-)) transporter